MINGTISQRRNESLKWHKYHQRPSLNKPACEITHTCTAGGKCVRGRIELCCQKYHQKKVIRSNAKGGQKSGLQGRTDSLASFFLAPFVFWQAVLKLKYEQGRAVWGTWAFAQNADRLFDAGDFYLPFRLKGWLHLTPKCERSDWFFGRRFSTILDSRCRREQGRGSRLINSW